MNNAPKQPAQLLYEQLKQDILEQKLPVGEALKQEELATQYGVSRIPIRDVLQKLKNEGWLQACGKRGLMIQPLSATEAEDLSLMRQYLEPLLLSHAIPELNNQILGQAEDILNKIDQGNLSISEYGQLNWQFHACLYQPAQRPTLFNTVYQLHLIGFRYIGFHAVELHYDSTSQAEHYQLLAALKSRDIDQALDILRQHIVIASEVLIDYLQRQV